MRREITDEIGAAARDRLPPVPRILHELVFLRRVDMVADKTGNHLSLLLCVAGE